MAKCNLCSCNCSSISQLKIHFKASHGNIAILRYTCGEEGCLRSFDSWRVYRYHLLNFHKCPNEANPIVPKTEKLDQNNSGEVFFESVESSNEGLDVAVQSISPEIFQSNFSHSIEILVAKLYQNPSMPRNFVQTLIDDISTFLTDGFIDILEAKVLEALKDSEAPQESIVNIVEMFKPFKEPFKGLTTDYRRMEHFKSNSCYIPPKPYVISNLRSKVFHTCNGPIIKRVKTTGQFIPLRLVLKNLFELPCALAETLKYIDTLKRASKNSISNVIQGQYWKDKVSHFNSTDIVIPINFYFDDVECNAALGPHSEKLGAGYVQIPVLPPTVRSKLENILLAILFDSDDRKSCEPGVISYNSECFEPLIKEFIFLEKRGTVCDSIIGAKQVYFVLSRIIGDNLGLHGILGFAEGFTANYPCTICRAPKEMTCSMTREDSTLLRNSENYSSDVALNDVSLTGIKEPCVFNKIPSFHVVSNQAVDSMHDCLEGVSHYVLIPVLKHCIDSKYFDVNTLNSRLFFFEFGPSDKVNTPPIIATDFHTKSKIKCTAREMLSLVRLLGVIVGDLVPESDEHWRLYQIHREILEILQAKKLPFDVADHLDLLVHEHHSLYMKLTGKKLPPKFHYLLHYGSRTKQHGPVVHISSMRGESKHREITKYVRAITSRQNLPLSAAIKLQLNMCLRFVSKAPLVCETHYGPSEFIDFLDYMYSSYLRGKVSEKESLNRVSWLDFNGTKYQPRMVLLLGLTKYDCFKFGKVLDIVIVNNQPLFICKVLKNLGFREHIGGFEVQPTNITVSIFHEELYDPFPLYDFPTSSGERVVVLKHYV